MGTPGPGAGGRLGPRMALDLYVMPLHRFYAGDYDPPLAKLGIPFKRITPKGVVEPPRRGRATAADLALGLRKAANVRAKVAEVNRVPIDWPDDGEAVYTEQFHGSADGLRAFATWPDYADRLSEFEVCPDGDYSRHPVWKPARMFNRPPTFPHLVTHSLFVGAFLPCDFERPVVTHTMRISAASLPVHACSTPRLAAELKALNDLLRVPEDFADRAGEFDAHPYRLILLAFDQVRRAAALSFQHRLPMIFEG